LGRRTGREGGSEGRSGREASGKRSAGFLSRGNTGSVNLGTLPFSKGPLIRYPVSIETAWRSPGSIQCSSQPKTVSIVFTVARSRGPAFKEERPSSARVLDGGLERRRAEDRVRRARSDLQDRRIRRGGCVGLFNGFVPGHGQLQEWFPHKPCAHSLNSPFTKAGLI
jgi:hypothetical protein